jgi:hypothetical protein
MFRDAEQEYFTLLGEQRMRPGLTAVTEGKAQG